MREKHYPDQAQNLDRAQIMLIDTLTDLGRYEEALLLAHEVMTRVEKTGDRRKIARTFTALEYLYFYMRNFEACERAIREALYHLKDIGMSRSHDFMVLSNNLADVYNVQGTFLRSV